VIMVPTGARVYLAAGRTDMRKGMNGFRMDPSMAALSDRFLLDDGGRPWFQGLHWFSPYNNKHRHGHGRGSWPQVREKTQPARKASCRSSRARPFPLEKLPEGKAVRDFTI
jgi:hypothetical protein